MQAIVKALSILSLFMSTSVFAAPINGDIDALNFALNLECLEAEYYSWAAYGKGLNVTQRGGGPPSVGGKKAVLGDYAHIANEIAKDEIRHVELLRSALGSSAVQCPLMNIGTAFSAAANSALNTTLSPPFSPYESGVKFLHGALLFEDVGVMAYNGAIESIADKKLSKVARSIMAIEAYHAGVIRTSLNNKLSQKVVPYGVPVANITDAIATALESLIAHKQNLSITAGLIPSDKSALAYSASARSVQNVVYLSVNATQGGFFPKGMNIAK